MTQIPPDGLLVFAGAGISKLAPSLLPDWFDFNRSLLEEAKACARRGLPALDAEAVAAVDDLDISAVGVEAFSDLIVRSFAAEGYFTVLDVLDADQANANHRALATLAGRGVVRAIVTTNFDTLIERAFAEAGVPLAVLTPEDWDRPDVRVDTTVLYKIHGSVDSTSGLVDTVSQKLRGLPASLRARLAALYRVHHVLVIGFSGGDLKFGRDYLAFDAMGPDGPGLTWLLRPVAAEPAEVAAIVDRLSPRARVVRGELPGYFTTLGVDVADVPAADADVQQEVRRRTQARIRRFFDEPYVGPLSCAAFCAALLGRTGRTDAAAVVRDALAVEVEGWGGALPKTAAPVLRTLASGATAEGDLAAAERWTRTELAFWEAVDAHLVDPPPEARAEWCRNYSATWTNLAVVQRARGTLDDARESLDRAYGLAERAGHPGLLALVLGEAATLAWTMADPPDRVVELMRRSISAAVDDGAADRHSQSRLRLAEILITLGEYDLALVEADYAAAQLALAVREETAVRVEIVRASVSARRGAPDDAVARLLPWLAKHPVDSPLGAQARVALAQLVGWHPPAAEVAMQLLEEVLGAMRSGHLPEGGLSGVPGREQLEEQRATVATDSTGALVKLLRVPGEADDAVLRGRIVVSELCQLRTALPEFFARLCRQKLAQQRFLRLLDVAHGLYFAASRAGDQERRLEAVNLAGVARSELDDPAGAITELANALATAPAGRQRDAIGHNLDELHAGGRPLHVVDTSSDGLSEADEQAWAAADVLFEQYGDVSGAFAVLQAAARA